MASTPKLTMTKLAESQASAELVVNDFLNRLDSMVFPSAKSKASAAPPGSPAEGDMYVVAAAPTGAWTGQANNLAMFYGGGWVFAPARLGMLLYIEDLAGHYRFVGGVWALAF